MHRDPCRCSGSRLLSLARYLLEVTPVLRYDRGTLVMREVPEVVQHLFTWDARSQLYRARGQAYREISELLRGHLVGYKGPPQP